MKPERKPRMRQLAIALLEAFLTIGFAWFGFVRHGDGTSDIQRSSSQARNDAPESRITQTTATIISQSAADPISMRRERQPIPSDEDSSQVNAPAPSLRDTAVDAELRFDEQGHLLPDIGLRHYFDYFLSTIGELDLAGIHAALLADLEQRLDPDQAAQARLLFERYLEYLGALDHLAPAATPGERFEQLFQLRRHTLGEDLADGFFAQEERYTRAVLEEQAILADPTLSLAERQQALARTHADLPETLRATREQTIAHHIALEQQQQFERQALDAEQRHHERAALFGEEAAQRLADLEQSRAQWQSRIGDYRQQREQILVHTTDPEQRQTQLRQLRESLFDAPEQRRIEALEALGFPGDSP